jgi:exosortase
VSDTTTAEPRKVNEAIEFAAGQRRSRRFPSRIAVFLLTTALLVSAFWRPLLALISLGLGAGHDADQYSQVVVIPLVCLYLILRKRKAIFAVPTWSVAPGASVLLIGFSFLLIASLVHVKIDPHDYFSVLMASFVVLAIANFILFFGMRAFHLARFPLLILVLMIPFPSLLLRETVSLLQQGSASTTAFFLNLTGVPFVREGLVFHLPTNLNVFIAGDCSGIRSSIALLIASLVASDVFLRKGWTKFALNLAVLPLSLVKNGLRVAVLSLLSVYVDRRFMFSDLHRDGGILFYLVACAVLAIFLWFLRKSERRQELNESQNGRRP